MACRIALFFNVLILQLTLGAYAWAEEPGSLVLTGPPWSPYLDARNSSEGLATEIVLAALNAAGISNSRVQLRPWRRVLLEASQGQVDGLIGLWYSVERESQFLFSDPYLVSPIVVLLPKQAEYRPGNLEELQGLRLAYRQGAKFGAAFDESELLDKRPVSDTLSMARMVARGRMDAGLEDGLVLRALLLRHPDLKALLRLVEQPLLKQPLHFGVVANKPGARQLLEAFNRGLKRIRANGRYQAILDEFSSVWSGVISVEKDG